MTIMNSIKSSYESDILSGSFDQSFCLELKKKTNSFSANDSSERKDNFFLISLKKKK